MRGERLLIRPWHRRAAAEIAERLAPELAGGGAPHVVTIAGESGCGKSETATSLVEELARRGVPGLVLQQDDYFVHPPRTNAAVRREEIGRVGTGEVRLDLLDEHLRRARRGAAELIKPLVLFDEDRIVEERLPLAGVRVLVAEGTYTSLLDAVDTRVFIALTYHQTRASRLERNRELQDDFLERVLEIEHRIIAPHRERAHLVIDRDLEVRSGPAAC